MSVIKLGGCNGSGKTFIARALLNIGDKWVEKPYPLTSGKQSKFYSQMLEGTRIFVLGKYDNACGGMDTISDKDDRLNMVADFASAHRKAIIFFEGLITGKTYGAMGALSEQHRRKGIPWLYAFMDTPFDVCVERVLKRRAAAGNDAPFDPERTMRPTFNSCQRLEQKLREGALPDPYEFEHHVHSVNHKLKPDKAASALLKAAMEVHNAR